jgi:hypothetical protein
MARTRTEKSTSTDKLLNKLLPNLLSGELSVAGLESKLEAAR